MCLWAKNVPLSCVMVSKKPKISHKTSGTLLLELAQTTSKSGSRWQGDVHQGRNEPKVPIYWRYLFLVSAHFWTKRINNCVTVTSHMSMLQAVSYQKQYQSFSKALLLVCCGLSKIMGFRCWLLIYDSWTNTMFLHITIPVNAWLRYVIIGDTFEILVSNAEIAPLSPIILRIQPQTLCWSSIRRFCFKI